MPSRLVSVCDSRLSDASQPHGGKFLSSEELLAFRQFFTRRADDVPLDARDFSTFPHLDQHSHDPVSLLCDDAASDLAEYGDSVQYHSSSHGHSDLRVTVGSPDSRSKQEDPLSALSVTRVESERVAPDNAPPLAEGDPSSISRARLPNVFSPTDAEYSHSEEMHDSLPDFLDLSPDIESPQPQQVTHEIPPLADISRFLPGDESPVVVLEDAMAGPSGGRNPQRFRGDRADPVLARSPTSSTRHIPRRVQSAAELDSGLRIPTQALPACAAAVFRADVTSRGYARRGYDASTGPAAGYEGGHAYSRSAVEPSDLWRGDSYYNRRVQHLRNGDAQHLKRGVLVSSDANSARVPVPGKGFGRPTEPGVGPPVSSSSRRPRASSAAASPTPSLSPLSRYRTLNDRAYHHPDVPRTPLFSDLDYDPSSWGPDDIVAQSQGSSPGRDSDTDDRLISSPETESTFPSPQSDCSQSSLRPARPRPRAQSRSGGEESSSSYPSRESSYARRPGGSSPDLPRGQSFYIGPPSASSLGIGLSTIDNGAFEAPRRAPTAPMPTPRAQEKSHPPGAWQRRKNSLRILTTGGADGEGGGTTVFRKPLRSLSLTRKASNSNGVAVPAPADPRVVRTAPPVSFRWQIWSKVQRPSERAGTPAGHLRAAGKSEPDFKTSFIETEEKPQRRGLLFIRKKS